VLIHNVRDPWTAIPSIYFTESELNADSIPEVLESVNFRKKYVDFPETSILENAIASFLGWNALIAAQQPDYTVRIEQAFDDLKASGLLDKDLPDKRVNARQHQTIESTDWAKVEKSWIEQLDAFCDTYGYPKFSDRL
jgi:hypothetical protein